MNEPAGFTTALDVPWDTWPPGPGRWWWDSGLNGDVSLDGNSNVVWTYPQGMSGGHVPGSKITEESIRFGPTIYERHEDVVLSPNFHGHSSSVNKFTYFPDSEARNVGITLFAGSNDSRLFIGINTGGWQGKHYDSRLRWNGSANVRRPKLPNLASPTQAQAEVFRGRKHTLEVLRHMGSPGQTDGWVKLWLDGLLILHYDAIGCVWTGDEPYQRGIHIAPVWGGTGDTVPADQTLSVGRSYYSYGDLSTDPGGPVTMRDTVQVLVTAPAPIPDDIDATGPTAAMVADVLEYTAQVTSGGNPIPDARVDWSVEGPATITAEDHIARTCSVRFDGPGTVLVHADLLEE